jgi:predicted RNA binding protein YcfA (HicA-like mRNA interferase family)
MQPRKLLSRVSRGDVQNVAFEDFCRLLERFGFANVRTGGSHRIYLHPAIPELVGTI